MNENKKLPGKSGVKRVFSVEEIEKIIEMFNSKVSINNIAKCFEITVKVIHRVLNEHNIHSKGRKDPRIKIFSDKEIKNIITLFAEDKIGFIQITKLYNIGKNTLHRILDENNIDGHHIDLYKNKNNMIANKEKVIELYQNGMPCHKIAKLFNSSTIAVSNLLKENNIEFRVSTSLTFEENNLMMERNEKIKELFRSGKKYNEISKELNVNQFQVGLILKSFLKQDLYCFSCKEVKSSIDDFTRKAKKTTIVYMLCNSCYIIKKEILRKARNQRQIQRIKNDPVLTMHYIMSHNISESLKYLYIKKTAPTFDSLDYTALDIRDRFNNYFKLPGNEWMNWKNRGIYNPLTWKDEDKSTWVWQLDHIKPKSDFNIKAQGDEEFRKCWALSNLRPLRAKDNILDGTRRNRHFNPKKSKSSNKIDVNKEALK